LLSIPLFASSQEDDVSFGNNEKIIIVLFLVAQQPYSASDYLIVEVSGSHTIRHTNLVGDRPVAGTST
jgi:hypothetical protein